MCLTHTVTRCCGGGIFLTVPWFGTLPGYLNPKEQKLLLICIQTISPVMLRKLTGKIHNGLLVKGGWQEQAKDGSKVQFDFMKLIRTHTQRTWKRWAGESELNKQLPMEIYGLMSRTDQYGITKMKRWCSSKMDSVQPMISITNDFCFFC